MTLRTALLTSVLVFATALGAHAELIVAANDGHQPPEAGQAPNRVPDSVAVLDLTNGTLKTLGSVDAPASIVGPPLSVAIAPNEQWAVVSGGTQGDPADMTKTIPDDVVSVIDISHPATPRVSQTLHTGQGVAGVAINKAGTMVMTANTGASTVSVFTVAHGTLTPAGTLQLEQGSRPGSVAFLPDGRSALIMTARGLMKADIADGTATLGGVVANVGGSIAMMTPDGKFAVINGGPRRVAPQPAPGQSAPEGRGGRGGRGPAAPPLLSLVDLSNGTIAATAPLGNGPEHIGISADGTLLAATLTNGSHSRPDSPNYNDFGLLKIYRVSSTGMAQIGEAKTGHWCQTALFSADNRTVLLQCGVERQIDVYHLDRDGGLIRDAAASVKFNAVPAAMATKTSH